MKKINGHITNGKKSRCPLLQPQRKNGRLCPRNSHVPLVERPECQPERRVGCHTGEAGRMRLSDFGLLDLRMVHHRTTSAQTMAGLQPTDTTAGASRPYASFHHLPIQDRQYVHAHETCTEHSTNIPCTLSKIENRAPHRRGQSPIRPFHRYTLYSLTINVTWYEN